MKQFTVEVTKQDGAKSNYFVLALSCGGAENVALAEVYSAKYALATAGWPKGVKSFDLFSRGAAIESIHTRLA